MHAAYRMPVAPQITFGQDVRAARLAQEHTKLTRSLLNFVSTYPKMAPLGGDPVVEQLLSASGFSKFDAAVLRIATPNSTITAIVVPTRLWRDRDTRLALHSIKAEASTEHTKCILVPQRWLRAPIRGQIARTLALGHRVKVKRAHLLEVQAFLGEFRMATIAECAACLSEEEDPVGIVLALCARGYFWIDRRGEIGAETYIASLA